LTGFRSWPVREVHLRITAIRRSAGLELSAIRLRLD
jgi:hypothetical protein